MGDQGQHIRIDLKGDDNVVLKCIAFSSPSEWFSLDNYDPHDFIIRPIINEWNGVRSVEATIIDVV